jgi:Raf kinase inhibitor-like YbhB/YbcL family protein
MKRRRVLAESVFLLGLTVLALTMLARTMKGLFVASARPAAGAEALGGLLPPPVTRGAHTMAFTITSTSFQSGETIPKKFTCDGADVSPELSWMNPPPGTQSFALISDDPDAPVGNWNHWVLFDLPAATSNLPEGVTKIDELPGGGRQGRNDFRKIGYGGPCPPPGKPHRYFFRLYALDKMLNLNPGSTKPEVEQAMQGHILGQAEWMGKYRR